MRVATCAGQCDSCQVAYVNGLRCHEHGCPDAWRDEERECRECGTHFEPRHRRQYECDDYCYAAYHGLPVEEE